jgi:CubicO group peptidase (beta-lactamase class C family)
MEKKYSWAIVGIISISLVTVLGITIPILLTPSPPPNSRTYLPTSTPEEQGMNSSKFEEMYDYIESNSVNLHSVLIARNGYIVEESYLENYTRREENYFAPHSFVDPEDNRRHSLHSCTKSIISLLIGIALDMGYLDNVSQTLYEFFENVWNPDYDAKKNITIEYLLTQTSGLPYGGGYGPDQSYILKALNETLLFTPGNSFAYSNAGCNLLSGIITNVTGQSAADFAQEHLFGPIGIYQDDWYWREDSKGITNGASGIKMTPRAMARIGILCLNNGSWNGIQVVSKQWILDSIEPSPVNSEYGYLWWVNPSFYLAGGYNGQWITVIPDYNITVIFTADIPEGVYSSIYTYIIINFIIAAVI